MTELTAETQINRRKFLIASVIGLPVAGALVADLLRGGPPAGHHTDGHLFDGTVSSHAFRQGWPDEAVTAAELTLQARDRFVAAVFTSGLGSVDWTIDVDGSRLPKRDT